MTPHNLLLSIPSSSWSSSHHLNQCRFIIIWFCGIHLMLLGAWISNNNQCFLWNVLSHPCPNFYSSLAKLLSVEIRACKTDIGSWEINEYWHPTELGNLISYPCPKIRVGLAYFVCEIGPRYCWCQDGNTAILDKSFALLKHCCQRIKEHASVYKPGTNHAWLGVRMPAAEILVVMLQRLWSWNIFIFNKDCEFETTWQIECSENET